MYVVWCFVLISLAGPSEPLNLRSKSHTDTTVSLSWTQPYSDGGRPGDVFYNIYYKTLGGNYSKDNPFSEITSTSFTVTGLLPMTNYTFVVVAENSVTESFSNEFPLINRTSNEISVLTKPSRKLHT